MEKKYREDEKLEQITELVSKMEKLKDENLALSKQYQSSDQPMISKRFFLGVEVGSRIDLDPQGTYYGICIFADSDSIKFAVVARKYSILNIHSHDFKETIKILQCSLTSL